MFPFQQDLNVSILFIKLILVLASGSACHFGAFYALWPPGRLDFDVEFGEYPVWSFQLSAPQMAIVAPGIMPVPLPHNDSDIA